MKCINPAKAFLAQGKVYFSARTIKGIPRHSVNIACGHCWQCRRELALDTAVRAQHESHYWSDSLFLTLTYDNEHLPENNSLYRPHITNFIRELKRSEKIMVFGCGEYGGKFGRPHYHLIIFSNSPIPREEYEKLWNYGSLDVGTCTPASIAYVCKYSVKKVLGRNATTFYRETLPEFGIFPKRPAMGKRWFEENIPFLLSNNFVYYNDGKRRIPRYYKKLLQISHPDQATIKSLESQQYMIESVIDSDLTKFARTYNYLSLGDKNSLRADNLDAFYLAFFNYNLCRN